MKMRAWRVFLIDRSSRPRRLGYLQSRSNHLRSLTLRAGSGEEARRSAQQRAVQGLGAAACAEALQAGIARGDVILTVLARRRQPARRDLSVDRQPDPCRTHAPAGTLDQLSRRRRQVPGAQGPRQVRLRRYDVDEGLVRELASGSFPDGKRNAIFIGGTGTGKTHLCIAVASAVIRTRARGRFFNLVDLVNQLEQEKAAGRAVGWPRSCCATISSPSTSSAICRLASRAGLHPVRMTLT